MTSFNHKNTSMFFTTTLEQWPPDQILDSSKIRGYVVNVSYLTGEETVKEAWSTINMFYSIVGINIGLSSRSRYFKISKSSNL